MTTAISKIPVSAAMPEVEREIAVCRQIAASSSETANEQAWQIGKKLFTIEECFRASPGSAEEREDLDSLKEDFRCLMTRISIAMRKQGKPGLTTSNAAPVLHWQSMGSKILEQTAKDFRSLCNEAAKLPPKIDSATTGNAWLIEKGVREVVFQDMPYRKWADERRDPEFLHYWAMEDASRAKSSYVLSSHFPKRTLRAKDIRKLSVDDLMKLSPGQFYPIVDLISADHTMALLRNENVHRARKRALYMFNLHLPARFAREQRALYTVPVEERVQQIADAALKKYKGTFPPDKFRALENQPSFSKLADAMMSPSRTLQGTDNDDQRKKWAEVSKTYLVQGLHQEPITPELLVRINSAVRRACPPVTGELGIRKPGFEILIPQRRVYYLPQRAVDKEIDDLCKWANEEIAACDRGEKNPILTATAFCQRMVSIHPCEDANGRTGRLLSDMILRRYGILPSGWKKEELPVYPIEDGHPPVTPTIAVQRMLEGLDNSYAIVGPRKEGG